MKDIPIMGIVAIVVGVTLFFKPELAAYLLGVYLILSGFVGMKRKV